MPCHACSDAQMPSQSPTMQSKTVALAPMPASMPSRSRYAAPCHVPLRMFTLPREVLRFRFDDPTRHQPRFAQTLPSPSPPDRLQSQDQDCSPKTVALAPSSLHAMSRLQRCADAFAIAHHAVQDRSLGPDACIHAFALTRCLRHRLRCSPRPTAVPRPRLQSQDRSLGPVLASCHVTLAAMRRCLRNRPPCSPRRSLGPNWRE